MLGDVKATNRGFEIVHFTDAYDQDCSLQQSSLAEYEQPGISAVWLGSTGLHRMHLKQDQVQESAVWLGSTGLHRMHLKQDQVQELIEMLQRWLDTGSFRDI